MALSVQTNAASLTGQRNLLNSTQRLGKSLERLSTGLRINRAADDASGLVISENQRAQISGLTQAVTNIDRAVNLVQTAESGLSEINSALLNIRQLAVDSANNGTLDGDALAANQAEIDNLLDTIDGIAGRSKFGTINLLDGSSGTVGDATNAAAHFVDATGRVTVPAGIGVTQDIEILTAGERAVITGGGATLDADETLTINGVVFNFASGTDTDQVVAAVNQRVSDTGVQARNNGGTLTYETVDFGSDESITVAASTTALGVAAAGVVQNDQGVDIGGTIGGVSGNGNGRLLAAGGVTVSIDAQNATTDSFTTGTGSRGSITFGPGTDRVFQVGAFENETAILSLGNFATGSLGVGTDSTDINAGNFTNLSQVNVETSDGAQSTIRVVDAAIGQVANARGRIGAFQANTLERTQSNVRTELQNLEEAESTVRDTEFASEIAKFTQEQIRQQAATTVLGLANQSSQGILSLLSG